MKFLIDRYGDLSKFADRNTELLERNGIPVLMFRFDGNDEQLNDWVDFGDFSFRNYDERALSRLQDDCCELIGDSDVILRHHLHISNGRLGVCDRQMTAPDTVPLPESDYIDLRSDVPVEQLREKARSFKLNTIACCQYCNGCVLDKSKRVDVPAAAQLE